MSAIADFARRYGTIMTAYILIACAVWALGMIALPQLVMVESSFRYIDRTEESRMNQQIDQAYIDLQRAQTQVRRLGRQVEAATGDERAALEADLAAAQTAAAGIQAQIDELEGSFVEAESRYGFENYVYLFSNELHRAIFLKTIWATAIVTLTALVVCYPIAFYLAKVAPGERAALLMLGLIVPYWINEILRTFAWLMILSYHGVFNVAATGLGLVDQPIDFLNQNMGVIIGMTYTYILFMVFPIYNTIDTLDKNQLEAARDLGAPWWRIHWRVVIPHAKPGIAVGCIMTFMLAAGSYAVPQILGGTSSLWFTQVIYNWFFEGSDWSRGSAYAFVLLVMCVVFIMLMLRMFRVRLEDISR